MMHEEETLLLEPERTRTARGESFQVADLARVPPSSMSSGTAGIEWTATFGKREICAGTWNAGKRRCRP